MQVQLSQGPHIALQVAEMATAEQVRKAFLELAKQFHPARFARMTPEIQKMANEVFLGIKAAHDSMLRALGASTRPGGVAETGGNPIVTSDRRPTPQPVGGGTVRGTAQLPPMQRLPSSGLAPRPTPSRGTPPRSPTPMGGVPTTRSNTPPLGVAIPRTLTPGQQRPGSPPMRPTPMPATRPLAPQRPTTPRGSEDVNPGTIRYAGSPPSGANPMQRPGAFDEKLALQEALQLMSQHNWAGARTAMQHLAARVPQSKPYRALLCYARGREAQAAGKPDDAAAEFQRALQLDPDLVQAKLALAEVKRR